ncbi:MAG: CHAD domain-containing protein, partial [Bacteroidota bacterium]
YKKLRAFLRMLKDQDKGTQKITVSKQLKKCYRCLGDIRDLQLQQQGFRKITWQHRIEKQTAINLLQKKINHLKSKFLKDFTVKIIHRSVAKNKSALPSSFPLSGFRNYVAGKWHVIHGICTHDPLTDEDIHAIRKNLKDLFYNAELYRHLSLDIQIPKHLLDELGNFQDRCRTISLLDKMPGKKLALPAHIKTDWLKQKQNSKLLLLKHIGQAIVDGDRRMEWAAGTGILK